MKPTYEELLQLSTKIGIDTLSGKFAIFKNFYPERVAAFIKECEKIANNTSFTGFSWKLAKLNSVGKKEMQIKINPRDSNSKEITITILKIYFTAGTKKKLLRLDDVYRFDDLWKAGDRLELLSLN